MSFRTTFILLAALILVAGYFLLAEEQVDLDRSEDQSQWFYSTSMQDIVAVAIHLDSADAAFRVQDDDWVFADDTNLPVDLSRWGGVTLLLSGPQSKRVVLETVEDLSRFGLLNPEIQISVTLSGQRNIKINLGDRTPDGVYSYAMQDGDPMLYLVDASWGEVLSRLATDPPYPEWYFQVGLDRMIYISVSHGTHEVAYTKDSKGWRYATQEGDYVDPVKWRTVLPHLGGPALITVLQPRVESFDQFGLLEPATVVHAEFHPPENVQEGRRKVVLEIGTSIPNGSDHYAKVQGQPYLLSVDSEWADAMAQLVSLP